jgi:hypothetical protein
MGGEDGQKVNKTPSQPIAECGNACFYPNSVGSINSGIMGQARLAKKKPARPYPKNN